MAATTKIWLNGSAPSCEDDDLNGFKEENNNLILGSGQALSTADHEQTHKAVAVYAAGGEYYTDSGVADAYVLSAIGAKVAPPVLFVGMRVAFTAGNTNTGTSTVNPAGLGVTGLKMPDGSNTPAGAITAGRLVVARYNGTNFILSMETFAPTTPGVSQASKVLMANANNEITGIGHLNVSTGLWGWQTGRKAFDLGISGALATNESNGAFNVYVNSYIDSAGTQKYKNNGYTAQINLAMAAGDIIFYTSPSGLAGGAVTVTERFKIANDGTAAINGNTAWHAGNLAAGTRGAIASNGGFSVPNAIGTFVALTAEAYDTDAIHDNVTNNTRLTVPAGISKVKVVASVAFAAAAGGDRVIQVYQNGAYASTILPAAVAFGATAGAFAPLNASSGVLNVAPGDYFELFATQTSGGALNAVCWFAMELIS